MKESQIKDKQHDKFNGPFQIIEIHNKSVTLLNLNTNQQIKVNFDRLKTNFSFRLILLFRSATTKFQTKPINNTLIGFTTITKHEL